MSALLALALIPPLFLLVSIYRMDKVEREPVGLIVKLFVFGCISVIPAALIEGVVIGALTSVMSPYSYLYLFIENFFCVALVEELMKYLGLKLGSWNNKEFDYCFDGIVYATTVALGFAAAENVLYVFQYGMQTAILRAVTAIPGHCIFGIFMGFYYGMAKYGSEHGFRSKAGTYRVLAIIVPMLLHGFYDFCASSGNELLVYIFFIFIIILDIIAFRSIRKFQRSDIPVGNVPPEAATMGVPMAAPGNSPASSTPPVAGKPETLRPDDAMYVTPESLEANSPEPPEM